MAWKKRINPISQEGFFSVNSGKFSYEEFAEKVYLMVHTYYLSSKGKIKTELGKAWDTTFGIYMTDEK